jgi:RNA polymerase sigma-70 factor, ECF subfamily
MTIQTAIYDENRKFLWNVCYRMTGNAADAEEIVQETFVRALQTPPPDTTEPWRPWLTRVAVNLSRDFLRRRRRIEYVGPWLPSPVLSENLNAVSEPEDLPEQSPVARYDLQESVSVAFLLALEVLTPAQRAVLLLRDVFDYSTSETAKVLEMTEANVKINLHRARRAMQDYDKNRQTFAFSRDGRTQEILEKFLLCLETRDLPALERLLTEDVVVVSDGAGEVTALVAPMQGRERVMRLLTQLYEIYRDVTETSFCVLNHQPAVIVERREMKPGHATRYTLQCEYDENGRIRRLNFVFAPSKLTAIEKKAENTVTAD